MDHHKSLYKDNSSIVGTRNRRLIERSALRANERNERFCSRRNISPEIGIDGDKDKKNENEKPSNIEQMQTKGKTLTRQEQYLQRFIAWKHSKKQQEEIKKRKLGQRPPFVPAGNNSARSIPVGSIIAQKDHKFTAPKGLKNPLLEHVNKRQSIYTVKNVPLNGAEKTPAIVSSQSSWINAPIVATQKPITFAKPESLRITRKPNTLKEKAGIEPKNTVTAITNTASTKATTEKTPVIVSSQSSWINAPIVATQKPITFAKPESQRITRKPNTLKEKAGIEPKNTVTATTNTASTKPINLGSVKPQHPKPTQPSAATAAMQKKLTNAPLGKAGVSAPLGTKQGGAVGKANATASKKRAEASQKPKLAITMKAKKVDNRKVPTTTKTVAAVKKVPVKLKLNTQQILDAVAQQISPILETPHDPRSQINRFNSFVTSTKRKSLSNSQSTTLEEFLSLDANNADGIVPLELAEVASTSASSPARCHKLENKSRKFNFARYSGTPAKLVEANMENEKEKESTPPSKTQSNAAESRPINYLSPYVSVTRGKVNSKTEKERRNSIYLRTDGAAIQKEEDEILLATKRTLETVRFFRKQLSEEIDRLHAICDKWETYKAEHLERLQETGGDDMINVAIGQTKLLTSKKFMQFKGLIDRCEKGATASQPLASDGSEDTKPITAVDLEGFWSMLGLQVDNIEKRFSNLERWCANDWLDPDDTKLRVTKVRKPKKSEAPTNPAAVPKARKNSALQQLMRKMQENMRKEKNLATTANDAEATGSVANVVILTPTQKKRSDCNNTPQRNQTPIRRVSIIVKDRRLHSMAPTVLRICTPNRHSATPSTTARSNMPSQDSPKILQHAEELRRSLTNLQMVGSERNDLLLSALKGERKRRMSIKMLRRTPSPTPATPQMTAKARKSILKTPGTAGGKNKSVVFNENLRVKKYKFTIDSDDSDNEKGSEDEREDQLSEERTYSLRTRKVHLRPSSEIQIPE